MPYFANFDPASADPHLVTGWYDTEAHDYGANLPAASHLLQVTEAQWAARLADPSAWAVSAGSLVAHAIAAPPIVAPAAPTLADLRAELAALTAKIAAFAP